MPAFERPSNAPLERLAAPAPLAFLEFGALAALHSGREAPISRGVKYPARFVRIYSLTTLFIHALTFTARSISRIVGDVRVGFPERRRVLHEARRAASRLRLQSRAPG
jgi:hypothetical protein